jgi:tetratricopeptide (TPR) repeat protein
MLSSFGNFCGAEDEKRHMTKGMDVMPSMVFCGFSDAFNSFREEEREDEDASEAPRSLSTQNEERFQIVGETYEEYDDGDDSSVVSSSGVSVLSINYDEADKIVQSGDKVDLSEIDDVDDESTVGSNEGEAVEYNEAATPVEAKPSEGVKPVRSTSGLYVKKTYINNSHASKNIQSRSVAMKDNPEAETKRKELLKDLKKSISSKGRYSVQVAESLKMLGEFHETWGQDEISVTLYQESLEIYSCELGDHDTNVSDLHLRLARGFERLGEENKALHFHSSGLFMISDLSGDYDLTVCDIRVDISKIIFGKGFHKEAVKELKKALKGYRMAHGDEHFNVAQTVDIMAGFYTDSGNNDKANNVRGELVKLMVALHGTKSLEVASSLEKWAMTHEDVGDLGGALRVMKQAYVMFHDIKGADSINAEQTLEKIGCLYSKMGRTEKAIKAHTSVALARKNRCGEFSVELAASYLMLGKAYMEDSKLGRALKALTRAMTCYGKANERKNDYICELMDTLHTIGVLHLRTSDFEKALKAFKKERTVRQRYIVFDELAMLDSIKSIAETLCKMQKFSESMKTFVEALQMIDRIDGRKLEFADALRSCGEALENYDENRAFTCFKESVQIFMANGYDEEHPSMKKAVLKLLAMGLEDITSLIPALRCSLIDGESEKFEF